MTLSRSIIDGLRARTGDAPWAILRGVDAPHGMMAVGDYPTLDAALAALTRDGFKCATGLSIPAPDLDGPWDFSTTLKYSAGNGRDVVLIQAKKKKLKEEND